MNAKKAKALRRYIRSTGATKVELDRPRTSAINHKNPITGQSVVYDLPLTARYADSSFQRLYRTAKRSLRAMPVWVMNARANAIAQGREHSERPSGAEG